MMFSLPLTLLSLATAVLSETIDVKVGDGGLIFEPNSITAQIGDSVRFQFYSGTGSHSVALSAFDTPCQPAENGFYSGIIQGNREGVRLPHLPSPIFHLPHHSFLPPSSIFQNQADQIHRTTPSQSTSPPPPPNGITAPSALTAPAAWSA